MIDAVLSFHMNPLTCGVAKFNHRLARELGVPCLPLDKQPVAHPLISIKSAEAGLDVDWPLLCDWYRQYDLFLHDQPYGLCSDDIVKRAHAVYAANRVVAESICRIRPDVIDAWCPSTIDGNPTRGAINVLTFGMAHKIQTARYEKLKALLDATGENYTVSVSTAIHEGSPWDETALVGDKLRAIFGDKTRVLGYLADDALARELRDASAVALFFEPALRANNTTFWAALDAGKPIVTNLDGHSPIPNGTWRILDIDVPSPRWFHEWDLKPFVMGSPRYDWSQLTELIRAEQPCVN